METTQFKSDLIELGVLTSLAGYRCLVFALPMYHTNPEQSITKQLYPDVGQMFTPKLTGSQVEKLIRYAVDNAWQNRDAEVWKRYFPQDRKPSNREFISRISEIEELKNN